MVWLRLLDVTTALLEAARAFFGLTPEMFFLFFKAPFVLFFPLGLEPYMVHQ